MTKFHINDNDEAKPCHAEIKDCKYSKSDNPSPHFDSKVDAEKFIEKSLDEKIGKFNSMNKNDSQKDFNNEPKMVELDLGLGTVEVEDGNLNNDETRRMLINGLCGDLAQAIYNKTGGQIYFVTYGYSEKDNEKFIKDIESNPDSIHETTTHVMIESPTKPGTFIDAYGQKTKQQIQSYYGFDNDKISMVQGNEKMLSYYHSGNSDKLGNFAESVLKLDKENKSFDYEKYGD